MRAGRASRLGVGLLALWVSAPAAWAWQEAAVPAAALRDWMAANAACRGGRGDDPRTQAACVRRDALDGQRAANGWCYGRPGDAGDQRVWRRCAEDARGHP